MWKLMYTDVYKEYYANKQEGHGVVIHTVGAVETVLEALAVTSGVPLPQLPSTTTNIVAGEGVIFYYTATEEINDPEELGVMIDGIPYRAVDVWYNWAVNNDGTNQTIVFTVSRQNLVNRKVNSWFYYSPEQGSMPKLRKFDLKNVDKMRMALLASVDADEPYLIWEESLEPYNLDLLKVGNTWAKMISQEGLFIKTYQSDVFNNWLNNTWIENINNRSKVQVDDGEFSIDSLLIMQKSWNYFNRIAVADGTLDSWREVTYAQRSSSKSLKPLYEGGLSKEILFDMVVSTAGTEEEPLGSIASRGQLGSKSGGR